jgi:hypothetical protein
MYQNYNMATKCSRFKYIILMVFSMGYVKASYGGGGDAKASYTACKIKRKKSLIT